MKSLWLQPQQIEAFSAEHTTAYRLASDVWGWIERYGNEVLISAKYADEAEAVLPEFLAWSKNAGLEIQRVFLRELRKQPSGDQAPKLIHGDSGQSLKTVAHEHGIPFQIDWTAGYSVGLFIDQRINRQRLHSLKSKKVLNCFAYTGSFSIVAALEGAETTSIDLSKKTLERAKENFALNQIDLKQHHFVGGDVFEWLPQFAKKGYVFDAIILDPPTFSRSKSGKVFRVEKDFSTLIGLAMKVATPTAHILLSTNYQSWNSKNLESLAQAELKKQTKRAVSYIEKFPADVPEDQMPATLWIDLQR